MTKTRTLTIQPDSELPPILLVEPEAYLSLIAHADGNELELVRDRAGLLLLAKAALEMAEAARVDGFHIYLDDLYDINAEGKAILIQREESKSRLGKPSSTPLQISSSGLKLMAIPSEPT